jgi:3-hydroxyisobutyrate dehydrogenase
MTNIGFIGLGNMGQPMASNLMQAGHTLCVYDINAIAMQNLVDQGAQAAGSIAELSGNSEVIFTSLQTGEQVSAVCNGEDGIFANAKPGTLLIDCSSIAVDVCRELHSQAYAKQIAMLDAPVSGGVPGAKAASLTIMVGGAEECFKRAQPFLSLLGKTIVHAGVAGNGQVAKICNNMILGVSMVAVAEAFKLAEQLGLPPKTFFDISSQASGQCWAMTSYNPVPGVMDSVPANNHYQPGFTSAMMLKDLNLSQVAAKTAGANTPMGELATALYQKFVETKHGDLDFSGIITAL